MAVWRIKYVVALVGALALAGGACASTPSSSINTPPDAVILAAPLSGQAPLLVDFSGVLSSDVGGDVVGYEWDLGDGTTSTDEELSHTYTVEGRYTVTMVAIDNKGGRDTDTVEILVNTDPTVTAGSDVTSGSTPATVNFTSSASDPGGSIVSTSWDFGDGNTATDANPSHTYLAAGTYDATVTVTDNLGVQASDSVQVTITGNAAPVAVATSDVVGGKTPVTVSFDGSTSSDADDGIASWDWDFGDGNTATGATPAAHTYTTAGTYTAELTVTDVLGAQDSATIVVTVADNIAPTALASLSNGAAKTGLPADFTGTPSNDPDGTIVSWAWVFGDGGTASGENVVHTYAAAGSYAAKLTVTDDNGATNSHLFTVLVADNVSPTASFSVLTDPPKTGLPVDFNGSASSDSDGTIASYAWDFGDTNTSTEQSPSHTYATAGTYDVTLTVTDNNGATDVLLTQITVADNVAPTAVITKSTSGGVAPLPVVFGGTSSSDPDGTIVSYEWDFGDSTSSTAASPSHTYAAAGTYTATLTVTDDNGATGFTSTVITVT